MESPSLHVAIVGGGLAGCTLANGLLKLDHVTFDVFEGGPDFSERGAQISLAANAQNALRAMGLDVDAMIARSGAVCESKAKVIFAEGQHRGAHLFDMDGTFSAHRPEWLRQLVDPLPKDRLHVNKKLVDVHYDEPSISTSRRLTLTFEDGTTSTADAVIGCDGIHSKVRPLLNLGTEHSQPSPAGFWDCRNVISIDISIQKLGKTVYDPAEPVQVCGAGKGVFFFSSPIQDGKLVGLAAAGSMDKEEYQNDWRRPLERNFLLDRLRNWGEFGQGLADCLMAQEKPELFLQWESSLAPTYAKGSICILGDAAHAMTPWQGAGAGMAMEDAMILTKLFEVCHSAADIPLVMTAYDKMRRERTQAVLKSSNRLGKAFCGQEDMQLTPKRVSDSLLPLWRVIWDLDMEEHSREAVAMFESMRDKLARRDPAEQGIETSRL